MLKLFFKKNLLLYFKALNFQKGKIIVDLLSWGFQNILYRVSLYTQ